MEAEAKKHFQSLVDAGHPVGEVIAVDSFLVQLKGLQPVNIHSVVAFDDGTKGLVHHVLEDRVVVLHMGAQPLKVGTMAVVQSNKFTAKVGKDFIGRVISVTGEPLDGKGAIAADADWPIFNRAPPIYARELLTTQLETGISLIDSMFPIVRGQRLAILGDSKSGKSTLASQIAINQRSTDQVAVYVMIAKRRSDVDALITRLINNKAMDKVVVVVSTIFESLVMSYLAPYVGCALAEYMWQDQNVDSIILYDDLTTHAHAYREISLIAGSTPGRDSYPGDMFHAHSSLLERAGRLNENKKCLTSVPIVMADGGDITSYLPTNIMSITDGQWILDMDIFREGQRPAINTGLSVTRVGTVGHNDRQKDQNKAITKTLTAYEEAKSFSQFGSEVGDEGKKALTIGSRIKELFTQVPGETYTLIEEQLLLDVVLNSDADAPLDIAKLKEAVKPAAQKIKKDEDFDAVSQALKTQFLPAPKPAAPAPEAAPAAAAATPAAAPAPVEAK
jgi:F-type H+-transporting ATPase subunit alpha